MNVSLSALRDRLFSFRSWDSSGTTLNNRVREAINTALDRLAGDVPEALVPDEEHVVLYADSLGTDTAVDARLNKTTERMVLKFSASSAEGTAITTSWVPEVDGTWDGLMHLEIKDPAGVWHRRQSREWWKSGDFYYVTLDRPWQNVTDTLMEFRIHQPEFFLRDDVMELLEPVRVWDDTRQQVWAIDTGGAYRQDMIDFRGNNKGRPYRMWRGRHFQMPTPRVQPTVDQPNSGESVAAATWFGPEQTGSFTFCYTIVWGRRSEEFGVFGVGQGPSTTGGASAADTQVIDPLWESAPSPVSESISNVVSGGAIQRIELRAENIGFMVNFDRTTPPADWLRDTRSGYRIRFYAARSSYKLGQGGDSNLVEKSSIFYMIGEVDPGTTSPTAQFNWTGSVMSFERPLRHSTGYYAWKVFPHQDKQYELDMRVLRLPRKFIDDQDTAPIQRDAVPALIELSLYYMCLMDGADQAGAQVHLDRFQELARRYRSRYANTGHAIEPVPLGGTRARVMYGRFSSTS
tara:strand:- start:106 stop:1659 length:1554 start_codon:yes stop_codon:yes gene_type:complete